jgi:hypothetical protein
VCVAYHKVLDLSQANAVANGILDVKQYLEVVILNIVLEPEFNETRGSGNRLQRTMTH